MPHVCAGDHTGELETLNLKAIHHKGKHTCRKDLELLELEKFDSVLILADDSAADTGDGTQPMQQMQPSPS